MTLTTTTSRVSYPGAGSVGPYAIPFRFTDADDLVVVIRDATGGETVLAEGADFTVTGEGNAAGTLTLTGALVVGELLSIRRAPTLTQRTSLRNQGSYFPAVIEDELDQLVMQMQSLSDRLDRSFRLPESYDPAAHDLELVGETGKVLGWASPTQLTNMTLDSSAVALPGNGRQTATLSAYLSNNAFFNVLDYAAAGDGGNDALALQRAIDAASVTGGAVLIPARAGGYTYLTPINCTTGKMVKGIRFIGLGAHNNGTLTLPEILIAHAGVGFDCTGSAQITFDNIGIRGDSVTKPKAGWLLARDNTGSSCGQHMFFNCRSRGYFKAAVVWNYGAEEDHYYWCNFINNEQNAKVIVWTGNNRSDTANAGAPGGLTSTFIAIGVGSQSMLMHNVFGGAFWVARGVANSNKSDVFYCEAANHVTVIGAWALAGSDAVGAPVGPGRSIMYVDNTNSTTNFVKIEGMRFENQGSGLQQMFGVLFGQEVFRLHSHWSIRDNSTSVGATRRTALAIGTTNASPNITSAGLFTATDEGAVIIGTGIPEGARIASVTNANAAVMTANATVTGAVADKELVFRLVFAGTLSQLDSFHAEQNEEDRTAGYQFSCPGAGTRGANGNSLQGGYIKSLASLIRVGVLESSVIIGDKSNWVIQNAIGNCVYFDTTPGDGAVEMSGYLRKQGLKLIGSRSTGWTVSGATGGVKRQLTVGSSQADHNDALRALLADLHIENGHGLIGP